MADPRRHRYRTKATARHPRGTRESLDVTNDTPETEKIEDEGERPRRQFRLTDEGGR